MADFSLLSVAKATPISPSYIALILACALFLFVSYRMLLPKPIPGIPCNEGASRSLFGDLPEIMNYMNKTQELWPWLADQVTKHQSPIVQVFARPFQNPWVVISDHREASDILLRRTKEFDRADFIADVFTGLIPEMHISFKTTDERFKSHRNLLKDLMTPAFLHAVAAPHIYAMVEIWVKLWGLKAEHARGHPFVADGDIYNEALDTIFATTFGLRIEDSNTFAQLHRLSSATALELPDSPDEPMQFPVSQRPATFAAILTLTESFEVSIKSPFPRLAHWALRQTSNMKNANAHKEKLFSDSIEASLRKLSSGHAKQSALDQILERETASAEKDGRRPMYQSRAIKDELMGFIIGGHDTTSTTLTWTVKYLAQYQEPQTVLRLRLREAYVAATAAQRNPTLEEIVKTQVPYLDAVLEESNRLALLFNGTLRSTSVDTTLFGYHIPRGTNVFLMNNGPGYLLPPLPIDEVRRSESSRTSKPIAREWEPDAKDMQAFRPERWLVQDENGKEAFDSQAGPSLAFGLGPRGCFGRRLAYLQLRIAIAMMIWNFHLLETPAGVSSWAATAQLTRRPRQCYVRLEKARF